MAVWQRKVRQRVSVRAAARHEPVPVHQLELAPGIHNHAPAPAAKFLQIPKSGFQCFLKGRLTTHQITSVGTLDLAAIKNFI